ncbi:HNH endonuclease family protein, partial [Streptomyces sp. NPDC127166]|uniref:HNH endonuclease family protein n=1 Tax=Streptomyces sp. NPDC127166 TaxID=3345380 RepID=UPI0036412402
SGLLEPDAVKVARPVLRGPRRPRGHGATRHEQLIDDPAKLDIDHMVPLAEAWDSGASNWDAKRREAYANDQGTSTSLAAVSARSNRQKADQDPAEWMPPSPEATCRYLAEWVGTKLRWGLSADQGEGDALKVYATGPCENTVVHYTLAP